jgi:quercetin dioxygenase-like cupin family protein
VPIEVYDYRTDVRNVVIMPEIRSRFLRMEPGEVGGRHSHDLGQEVFLILDGQCEFEIDGEYATLGPGQMCFAKANQMHHVRVVGDQPMTMYLSVTPHIEPTHTSWDDQGNRLPPRYGGATANERADNPPSQEPVPDLIERHLAATKSLAAAATEAAKAQESGATALAAALAAGDKAAAKAATDAMSEKIIKAFAAIQELGATWNEIAATVAEPSH